MLDKAELSKLSHDDLVNEILNFSKTNEKRSEFLSEYGMNSKKDLVSFLIDQVMSCPDDDAMSTPALESLRILCREKAGMDQLFTTEMLRRVISLARGSPTPTTREESVKLLVNVVIASPDTRPVLAEHGVFDMCWEFLLSNGLGLRNRSVSCRVVLHLTATHDAITEAAVVNPACHNSLVQFLEECVNGSHGVEEANASALEVLKALYSTTRQLSRNFTNPESPETAVGIATYERLFPLMRKLILGSFPDPVKLATLNLVMNIPTDTPYTKLIDETDETTSTFALLNVLGALLDAQTTPSNGDDQVPLLGVLHHIVKDYPNTRLWFHDFVFPPAECSPSIPPPPVANPNDRTMVPSITMPRGSLRQRLVENMTSISYNLKTYTSEFLFLICNEEVDELVRVAGVGKSAGLLAEKGLLGGGGLRKS